MNTYLKGFDPHKQNLSSSLGEFLIQDSQQGCKYNDLHPETILAEYKSVGYPEANQEEDNSQQND